MSPIRAITDFFLAIFYFAISIVPIASTVVLVLLFRALRSILGLFLTIKHGRKVQFMDGLDAVHLRRFDDQQIVTGIPITLHGRHDMRVIRDKFASMLAEVNKNNQLVFQRFKYTIRICLNFGYWLPVDELRIEDHVKRHECEPPKNDHQLHRIYGELYGRHMKYTDKPPWTIYVIQLADDFPGLEPGPNYVILMCFSHIIIDGVSIVRLLVNYFPDKDGQYDQIITSSKKPQRASKITQIKQMLNIAKTILYTPLSMSPYIFGSTDSKSLTGRVLSGTKLIAFSRTFALDRVKRIKNLTGCTVNDVLMSLVAAGLRAHCLRRKEDVSKVVIRAMIPVSLHKLSEPESFVACNNCSYVIYTFPLKEDTAIKRLLATKQNMNRLKTDGSVMGIYYLLKYCFNSFPFSLHYALSTKNQVSCFVSNTPGPQKKATSMNGDDTVMANGIITHGTPKIGLSFSLCTGHGKAQVGVNIDAVNVSDQETVQQIADDCAQEIDRLESELE